MFLLQAHTHFSFLKSPTRPKKLAQTLKKLGYNGACIADTDVLSGCPEFVDAMQEEELKPLLGQEFNVISDDESYRLLAIAQNPDGWRGLMRASEESWRPQNYKGRPQISLASFRKHSRDLFVISGMLGSEVADLFKHPRAYFQSYEEARELVREDWRERVNQLLHKYQEMFGANFFAAIQMDCPASVIVSKILRQVCKQRSIPTVACLESFYCDYEEATDQRVLLSIGCKKPLPLARSSAGERDPLEARFWQSNHYIIPDLEWVDENFILEEIENTNRIADACDPIEITRPPLLPKFPCPNGKDSLTYLKDLCKTGWNKKVSAPPKSETWYEYGNRVKMELGVLEEANLSDYFLITWDEVRYAREELGCTVGRGRGSAAGCLVSYLLDITQIDPIRFNLSFSRFYNSGRNTSTRIALPDIDVDFPTNKRDEIISYLKEKYGHDKVCHMATFGKLKGRSALTDVANAFGKFSFLEVKEVTKYIPDEAAIADVLADIRKETGSASILQWSLDNVPELSKWCEYEDGEFDGPMAAEFRQAIRLEGVARQPGRHASGIIVCSEPLADVCPMFYDQKTGDLLTAYDMHGSEAAGLVKLDVLGTTVLDKLDWVKYAVREGIQD